MLSLLNFLSLAFKLKYLISLIKKTPALLLLPHIHGESANICCFAVILMSFLPAMMNYGHILRLLLKLTTASYTDVVFVI